ncbi:hypothetical protein M877_07850 [Streptomyces niveus NCIMB 11891]|nr:hypothetical protein M877_07850 [Streptomyces niveus NCIMB 11891]
MAIVNVRSFRGSVAARTRLRRVPGALTGPGTDR